ncbi:DUF5615 family PIN-like protein [Dyella flagellata]
MKFLIDECLSPALATQAQARGYLDSVHIEWRGLSGKKDWDLMPIILNEDWTFVTKNSRDFRGSSGSGGLYAKTEIHAGLVCLNGPVHMDLDMMTSLFEVALDALDHDPDLVNAVLDITLIEGESDEDDRVNITRYDLPKP